MDKYVNFVLIFVFDKNNTSENVVLLTEKIKHLHHQETFCYETSFSVMSIKVKK